MKCSPGIIPFIKKWYNARRALFGVGLHYGSEFNLVKGDALFMYFTFRELVLYKRFQSSHPASGDSHIPFPQGRR